MAPDLNTLPPSSPAGYHRTTNLSNPTANGEAANTTTAMGSSDSPPPSARSASTSLQAAATMNAGLQHEPTRRSSSSSLSRHRQSPHAGRRRSAVLMNLQLNDPSLPAPGEMVNDGNGGYRAVSPQPLSGSPVGPARDPHHNRAPSLGELHQELEAEQEAQVNRLLLMIRQQQLQLQQLQAAQGQSQTSTAAEDTTPTSERSSSVVHQSTGGAPPGGQSQPTSVPTSAPRSPVHPRSSFDMARADLRRSRTPSRGASSPRFRSTSISGESEQWVLGGRDESAFYQAETQSMVRENQMLRHRIRELERQLSDNQTSGSITREPVQPSHLLHSTSATEEEGNMQAHSASAADVAKEE